MAKNSTHLTRAAKAIAATTELTYAQALGRVRTQGIPDLGDPIALARFALTPQGAARSTPTAADKSQAAAWQLIWAAQTGEASDVAGLLALAESVTVNKEDDRWVLAFVTDPDCVNYAFVPLAVSAEHLASWFDAHANGRDVDYPGDEEEDADHEDNKFGFCACCRKPAGADYHLIGAAGPGDNNVSCDDCWDERLR